MTEKKIYSAPEMELIPFAAEPLLNWQSGVNEDDTMDPAKKHKWNSWTQGVDSVFNSARSHHNSPLELPSGGKLWED